jgi:glycosyltransferase involved in cell wall biosynthesis
VRILVVTTHRGVIGGTETYLREVLPALRARGHELALAYNFPAPAKVSSIDNGLDLPAWECQTDVPEAAQRWRPDFCFLHMSHAPALDESLVHLAPTVLFAHGFYATCASGLKCHGWGVPTPCARKFGASCLPLNYALGCGIRNPLRLWENYRKQSRRARLLSRFHRVLTASRYMAQQMQRQGVPADRVTVAPYPAGSRRSDEPPSRRPIRGRILLAGRFTGVKGGDVLIRAAASAAAILGRTLTLVFTGSGPEEPRWRDLAVRLGVPAEFHGWCPNDRLAEIRRGADLVAVPSLWPEPFGLVGVEAGCEGLPAVGFAVGGIPDWLIPGESGESAPAPPSPEGLAGAIVRALSDPDYHHRLRVGAWLVAGEFTAERHLRLLQQIFCGAEQPINHERLR